MTYSYDRTFVASRVTFGKFGKIESAGGGPAAILLDGVRVGEIERDTDMHSVGVMQKKYTVRAYLPSIQGPIGFSPEAEAKFEDKEFKDLSELKRALTSFLGGLSEGVSEAYRLFQQKKISVSEWQARVKALL